MTIASRLLLLGAVWLAGAGLVRAQTSGAQDHASPGVVEVTGAEGSRNPQQSVTDRGDEALKAAEGPPISDPTVFIKGAVLGDLTEIGLAKLARTRSQDPGVQKFAARVLKESDATRLELTAIAKRKRLGVPTSLVYEDEQTLQEGAGKSGVEFDSWYTRQMIAENDRAVALFEGAARMEDPELAQFAKKTLPTLDEHKRLATALVRAPTN